MGGTYEEEEILGFCNLAPWNIFLDQLQGFLIQRSRKQFFKLMHNCFPPHVGAYFCFDGILGVPYECVPLCQVVNFLWMAKTGCFVATRGSLIHTSTGKFSSTRVSRSVSHKYANFAMLVQLQKKENHQIPT